MARLFPRDAPNHPGRILAQTIRARGISQRTLAEQLGYSRPYIGDIIARKRGVSVAVALRIEEALAIPAQTLLYAQVDYDIARHRRKQKEEQCTTS